MGLDLRPRTATHARCRTDSATIETERYRVTGPSGARTAKICLACSHGGHLTEMLELSEAFRGHDVFYITYESERTNSLTRAYTFPNLTKHPASLLTFVPRVLKVLLRERPRVVVSTGAELAIPVFYLAKLLGIRTVFIESCCRVVRPSVTGRLVYPLADMFLVQWPSLLMSYGPRARYKGSLL